jgi:phage gpG-like protein
MATAPTETTFKQSMDKAAKCLEGDALQPALALSLDLCLENVAHNFEQSATAAGQAWVPRKNVGDGHPLLIDTGRLAGLASNVPINQQGQSEHVRVIEDDQAYFASTVPYAATHEHGDPSRNIPQRQFMGVDGETVDLIVGVFADHVAKLVDDALKT